MFTQDEASPNTIVTSEEELFRSNGNAPPDPEDSEASDVMDDLPESDEEDY